MRHQNTKKKLDRNNKQRKALLGNLANSLILHEKIVTTEAKAKVLKPRVEKLITRSKINTLHNRRLLSSRLPNTGAAKKLLEVLGPKYKDRKGGYVRIVKMGMRKGDGAKMAAVELV